MLVISNRSRASRSSDFEITRSITPWIVLHSVQLLLLIIIIIISIIIIIIIIVIIIILFLLKNAHYAGIMFDVATIYSFIPKIMPA